MRTLNFTQDIRARCLLVSLHMFILQLLSREIIAHKKDLADIVITRS